MAFTPSFTIGQNPLTPAIIVATDTSVGSDAAIDSRRIFIQDAFGNYLVPLGTTTNYVVWDLVNISISLNVLSQNTAVNATTQWLDISGNVLYTDSESGALANYGKQFLYYLVELQSGAPDTVKDNNYDFNTAVLWTAVLGGINAVFVNNDIAASQNSLGRATELQFHQNDYF